MCIYGETYVSGSPNTQVSWNGMTSAAMCITEAVNMQLNVSPTECGKLQ